MSVYLTSNSESELVQLEKRMKHAEGIMSDITRLPQVPLRISASYLLREPASEEGVKVFSIEPHKALQILSLVDLSLVLLLCQF